MKRRNFLTAMGGALKRLVLFLKKPVSDKTDNSNVVHLARMGNPGGNFIHEDAPEAQLPSLAVQLNVRTGARNELGTLVSDHIEIGDNVTVKGEPSQKLYQWQRIGNNVSIGRDVEFGPWNVIGDNVVLGDGVKLGNWSIVLDGAIVPDGYVFEDNEVYPSKYAKDDRSQVAMMFYEGVRWAADPDKRKFILEDLPKWRASKRDK